MDSLETRGKQNEIVEEDWAAPQEAEDSKTDHAV